MAKTLIGLGGEAAVRTVAPGFKPGVPKRAPDFVSALQRAKELAARNPSLSPAQAGSQNWGHLANPRLKAGGYGSYAGFADGSIEINPPRRTIRRTLGGVAAIRAVAPGFKPGVPRSRNVRSALQRAKERGLVVGANP